MKNTTYRIAIADTQVLFRQGLIEILSSLNCDVLFDVDNGKELVERLNATTEKPDLCIFEIDMPELNGYETVRLIKERWPDVAVLILSSHNNVYGMVKLLCDGADGFLLKSCSADELSEAIASLKENGCYCPQYISGRMMYLLKNKQKDLPVLTDKELRFLSLCMTDMTYKEIANQLYISPRTVDKMSSNLFEKIGVATRTSLAVFATSLGLSPDFARFAITNK